LSKQEGGKLPRELDGKTPHELERHKMENLLQVVSKWERDEV
jgi:hypothetical protein